MAVVIPFKPKPRSADRSDATQPAAILFFTGVRYERLPEAAPKAKRTAARRAPSKDARRSRQPA